MFNKDEYVVYKRNVCKIKDIKDINNNKYYVLEPIDDNSLTISIIFDIKNNNFRKVISRAESEKLIETIPSIKTISENDKLMENEYKKLIGSGNLEDLIKIIKTTYIRNKDRLLNHKKIGEKDENYFNKAETMLYNELSISLGKSYEDTKKYVVDKVTELQK